MLLRRLKLTNYGGIYNGMGLYDIDIDFTKCTHRIIMIKGDNGTGKSTIENALKPLPDDNSSFITTSNASKLIEYYDEISGDIYSILFLHECKTNGRTTKGYIKKNGVELNASGNITSCKDIIFEELQLDPNYITLTQLSSTKRGIADMRPSDRKRYVNSILSTTEVYNDIHKKLSKKSSTYKSMMNNIVSKLDSIGNVGQLQQSLNALNNHIETAESQIEKYTGIKNQDIGILANLDPGDALYNKIIDLKEKLEDYTNKYNEVEKELQSLIGNTNKVITNEMIESVDAKISDISSNIINLKSINTTILEKRQVDAAELEAKSKKLKNINGNTSLEEVKTIKHDLQLKKSNIEYRWNKIVDINKTTKDEFITVYELLKDMKNNITGHYNEILMTTDFDSILYQLRKDMEDIDNEIDDVINNRNIRDSIEDKLDILKQRPKECKIDKCPFIADALESKQQLSKLNNNLRSLKELNMIKSSIQDKIENVHLNKSIYSIYKPNARLLSKMDIGINTYIDCLEFLLDRNDNMSIFDSVISYVNDIEEYKLIEKNILEIEMKYNSLSSQENFINMLTDDIFKLNQKITNDSITIENNAKLIKNLKSEYDSLMNIRNVYIKSKTLKDGLSECAEVIDVLKDEIKCNESDMKKIETLKSDIEKIDVNISELKEQLNPLKKDRDSLEYRITLSGEYTSELNKYQYMFKKIETLKYYSSPTTGIQILFANMYLSKIMTNANKILSNLFNGTFTLLPLVITESEFRIPVAVNNGINHDDITSMSSAQISLISMIISISLLSQTSTRLNIIVGDEIDAPFDSENRREFISILYQLMGLVNSSQCVLISHNSEISLNDCDVILLKSDNDIITDGNIIWSYK